MKLDLIAGARPNFVKIAAIIYAIQNYENNIQYRFIHTGQHYDDSLSGSFIKDLELPVPNINLGAGSGSQAEQTAAIMVSYENLLKNDLPDLCLVVGDVTSSMACAITAKKMKIKIVHVEAGIRSGDYTMPEEINRILIDSIADYLFTTTKDAKERLLSEGKTNKQVFFVGNTMIDTLLRFQPKFRKPKVWDDFDLQNNKYLVLTLHRPANVDELNKLEECLSIILEQSQELPVIFPVHPRTMKILENLNLNYKNLHLIPPLSYLEFNYLVQYSKAVLTDSGGITEETTVFGIPCLTLRNNTERPETVHIGTNEIIGTNPNQIKLALEKLFNEGWKNGSVPEKWDGKSGQRILKILNTL